MTSPLRGFSSCGAGHPHRPERRTSASRRSSGCSNSIESVAWMPRPSSARYDSPPIKVADGVTEAASVRLHSLIIRLHVVNRELTRVERKLDELCALAAHIRLRNTVYHWARIATQHDPKSRARYAALRRRGHSHGRAIRGVADRLLALACVLLQRQTLFDPRFARAG
jgi:hypothetical protein